MNGCFFQDSGVGTPVTLRVDKHGFYLHWIDQNNEMDLLDISTIRDSRTGKYARIPKVRPVRVRVRVRPCDQRHRTCRSHLLRDTSARACCGLRHALSLFSFYLLYSGRELFIRDFISRSL